MTSIGNTERACGAGCSVTPPSFEAHALDAHCGGTDVSTRSGRMVRSTSVAAVAVCVFLCGCPTARIIGRVPAARPATIYVADFKVDVQNTEPEKRLLPSLPAPPGAAKEPAVRARELVDLMSTSLVQDLTAAGLTARRLAVVDPMPADGWMVRGIFTQAGEGSLLHLAVVGFGAGQTTMQVIVALDDLAHGVPKPFYELSTSADGARQPGGAITLSPYVASAKFALSGGDLETNVKQTAAKIADNIAQLVQQRRGPAN